MPVSTLSDSGNDRRKNQSLWGRFNLGRFVDADVMSTFALGALGGLMYWLWRWLAQDLKSLERVVEVGHLLPFVVLGAGSAVVFVFLVANVDRRDRPRLHALALLGGFAFSLVLETWDALSIGSGLESPPPQRQVSESVLETQEILGKSEARLESEEAEDATASALLASFSAVVDRISAGKGAEFEITSVPELPESESWVTLGAEDAEPYTIERRIEIAEYQFLEISVRPKQVQDLMAVLFEVLDADELIQVDFDDDYEAGTTNPKLEVFASEGIYLLRILTFSGEPIEPVEVRVTAEPLMRQSAASGEN